MASTNAKEGERTNGGMVTKRRHLRDEHSPVSSLTMALC